MALAVLYSALLFCVALPLVKLSHEMIVERGKIVKLYDSKDRGARLLGRTFASEMSDCLHACLAKTDCDTAIYHEDVVDGRRQNCFFLSCGVPNKCLFSDHPGFIVLLRTSSDSVELEPVDCQLSEWSAEAPCSVTCGNGVISYQRSVVTEPRNGGQPCPSEDQLRYNISCSLAPCRVDCQLSSWSFFGKCSTSCGPGMKTRYKTIIQHPSEGGIACPKFENLLHRVYCKEKDCLSLVADEDVNNLLDNQLVIPTREFTPIIGKETAEKDTTATAAVSTSLSLAEQEVEMLISRKHEQQTHQIYDVNLSSSSPVAIQSSNSPTVSSSVLVTSMLSSLLMLEQELNEEPTRAVELHDTNLLLVNESGFSSTASHSKIQQTISAAVTESTPQGDVPKHIASVISTNHSGINTVVSTTVQQVMSNGKSLSSKLISPTSDLLRSTARFGDDLLKTEMTMGSEREPGIANTGGTERYDEDIEFGIRSEDSEGGDNVGTAVLVLALVLGILFVIASFVLTGRHWYNSFKRRRRYTRMEYLINDVSD